jgi:hypothetical protein
MVRRTGCPGQNCDYGRVGDAFSHICYQAPVNQRSKKGKPGPVKAKVLASRAKMMDPGFIEFEQSNLHQPCPQGGKGQRHVHQESAAQICEDP